MSDALNGQQRYAMAIEQYARNNISDLISALSQQADMWAKIDNIKSLHSLGLTNAEIRRLTDAFKLYDVLNKPSFFDAKLTAQTDTRSIREQLLNGWKEYWFNKLKNANNQQIARFLSVYGDSLFPETLAELNNLMNEKKDVDRVQLSRTIKPHEGFDATERSQSERTGELANPF